MEEQKVQSCEARIRKKKAVEPRADSWQPQAGIVRFGIDTTEHQKEGSQGP